MKLKIEQTRSGDYTAKVSYFEETLNKEVNLYLCSKFNPVKEAQRWAEEIYEEDKSQFVVYGMGMGYHIEALAQKLNSNQELYVIDVNTSVWKQVQTYSPLHSFKQKSCYLCITDKLEEIVKVLDGMNNETSKLIIYLPSMKIIPRDFYQLKNILERFNIEHNNNKFTELIKENYQYNNTLECENVNYWYDRIRNKPIIIVSGGPSLDKNIDWLKQVNENVFVFSTGRTLKVLVEKGIRVDMFCIIDSQEEWTYKQIQGIEHLQIPFVFLNTASHYTVSQYQGPKYRAYSMDSHKDQEGRIESGGSVATAMLDLAIRFGGNPIVFIGQDLAYTNNVSHCENSINVDQLNEVRHMKQVKGIDGKYLPTTAALLSYKYWIEQKIRKTKGRRFINATEGGAYIEGCELYSLECVLKEFKAIRS